MKLIIAGSRHIRVDADFIKAACTNFKILDEIEDVISGGAEGVDWGGEEFAIEHLDKEAIVIGADWANQGVAAGPIRNKKMADVGDALLLIWNGKSKGSASMKTEILKLKKPIYEIVIKDAE